MQEVELFNIIEEIPLGKKRHYFNKIYLNALSKYYQAYTEELVDINELVVREFNNIVEDNKPLLTDIIKFSDKFKSIFKGGNINDIKAVKQFLYNKYGIESPQVSTTDTREFLRATEITYGLHDFQERIRRKIISQIFEGVHRFLIHMPTGSGKTRTAVEIIVDFIRISSSQSLLLENINILWIAQSEELCIQAYKEFDATYSNKGTVRLSYGHYYGERTIDESILDTPSVIFCGIQKLHKNYKDPLWKNIKSRNYLVVVDEAHRSIASQWVKALDFFVKNSSTYVLGLTATPGIGNRDQIEKNFSLSTYYSNNKVGVMNEKYTEIKAPIKYLTERGFLARINRIDIESKISLLNAVKSDNHLLHINPSTLEALSIDPNRNVTIVNIIKENIGKKILVFTCGVHHSRALQRILKYNSIDSEIIDQGTINRESIISNFKNGSLNVLLNYGVLIAGFDAPKTNICIIARPVDSIVMYSQMVGRILRGPHNGKGNEENTLYTIKDNLNHGDYDNLYNSFNEFWEQ
jgi:superfamily II DNA or RNA helicase